MGISSSFGEALATYGQMVPAVNAKLACPVARAMAPEPSCQRTRFARTGFAAGTRHIYRPASLCADDRASDVPLRVMSASIGLKDSKG
jgi:hypothetical protein